MWLILIIICGVILAIVFMSDSFKKETQSERHQQYLEKLELDKKRKMDYEKKLRELQIHDDCDQVNYEHGFMKMDKIYPNYIWVDNEKELCFFSTHVRETEEENKVFKIPIADIEYFHFRGEVFRENKISGGGGGGSSVGRAIVGGVVAGAPGAIIASRNKVNEIKSELITHDTREMFINLFFEGKKRTLYFKYKDYNTFLKLIPDKAYINIAKKQSIFENKNSKVEKNYNNEIMEQIRKMAKLKEDGILSEEEFNEKKKVLLDKIS